MYFIGAVSLEKDTLLGHGQYHLAVAGGYAVGSDPKTLRGPTRYREVVLTVSKCDLNN